MFGAFCLYNISHFCHSAELPFTDLYCNKIQKYNLLAGSSATINSGTKRTNGRVGRENLWTVKWLAISSRESSGPFLREFCACFSSHVPFTLPALQFLRIAGSQPPLPLLQRRRTRRSDGYTYLIYFILLLR